MMATILQLGHVVQSVVCLTEESEVSGSILVWPHTFVEIDHEIFSVIVFPGRAGCSN